MSEIRFWGSEEVSPLSFGSRFVGLVGLFLHLMLDEVYLKVGLSLLVLGEATCRVVTDQSCQSW